MCIDVEGELRVTSYRVNENPLEVEEVYDARLDAVSLEVLEEQLVELNLYSSELCQPEENDFLSGEDGETLWGVRYVEHEDVRTEERWTEALLTVGNGSGEIIYSFNRHLNTESPYLDTSFFWDGNNTLAGMTHDGGSAAFYLNNYFEAHIDVIVINDMAGVLASPGAHVDEEGYGIPDARNRFELWDDPASVRNDVNDYSSIHLAASPDEPGLDLLTVFGTGPSLIRGFEVDRAGNFVERPELGLDSFWSQFGWDNAGFHGGVLQLQSHVASFSNSVLMELDPIAWTVVREWEIGCIGPPSSHGFQMLNEGMRLRFAYDGMSDDVSRVMFIRNGDVIAIGDVPFVSVNPTYLVSPDQTAVYVAHYRTGEITAIAVP